MKPRIIEMLEERGIGYRLLHLPERAYTVDDVVRLAGVERREVCKTILLMGRESGEPLLVIVPGDRRMNIAKIEEIVGEKLRFARPEEIKEITGYEMGALPPYGHKRRIRTIVDRSLLEQERVNFGSGRHNLGVEIRAEDLSKITRFEVEEIST